MLKKIVSIAVILLLLFNFAGCRNSRVPEDIGPENTNDLICGLNETCSNGTYYIKLLSFEVSTEYPHKTLTDSESGYYVLLGVETDMTENEFSLILNGWTLYTDEAHLALKYNSYDKENSTLIYDIPQLPPTKSFDYSRLLKLKVSDLKYDDVHSDTQLSMYFYGGKAGDVGDLESRFNNHVFWRDGVYYTGTFIRVNLEYQESE